MIFLLSFFFAVITSTLHIDLDFVMPVDAANAIDNLGRIPLECNDSADYTVQIVWRADLQTADKSAIQADMTRIVEQASFIFWNDSDSYTVARYPRWKTTPDCQLDIRYINTNEPVPSLVKTKQVVIEKRFDYCGLATTFDDARPAADNAHNSSSNLWISTNCLQAFVLTHELLHSFGAVQEAAPHHDGNRHVVDKGDIMQPVIHPYCIGWITIDCGKDDYWSVRSPLPYWNTADSAFLIHRPKYTIILPLMMRNDEGS